MVYVSNQQLTEGMSAIKVEDESEEMIANTGRSGAGGGNGLNQRKFTVGYDSRRSNEQSSNPDRATSNQKGSASNTRKPPTFAAQGSVRYSMRGAQKVGNGPMSLDPTSNDNQFNFYQQQ